MTDTLFSSYKLGRIELKNRVAMAPMTRSRSTGNTPIDIVATYYEQRSEAGLLITEGTAPSPNGLGYPRIPGLFNKEQAADWKKVTDAVHGAGSRIFVQLMHTGRVTHPLNQPEGSRVLAPSALAAPDPMFTDTEGPKPCPVPEVMTEDDIGSTIEEYALSAELAIEGGFDGVELHGANGYLIDQFLNTASNQRSDRWGGAVENRIRFAVEVAKRVAERIGGDRTGIRLSPYGVFNGMAPDDEHDELFERLAEELGKLNLAYIHIVDHSSMGAPAVKDEIKQTIRKSFGGTIVLSGGYGKERAERDLQAGSGQLVAFGRPFIANPKLVSKLRTDAELVEPDPSTFYTPGKEGYIDYPVEA